MTSTLLQTYEDEFRDVLKTVNEEIIAIRATLSVGASDYTPPPQTGPLSRVQRSKNVAALLAQLRELITSMEYESNDIATVQRQTVKDRISDYRRALQALEGDMGSMRSEVTAADRSDLMGKAGKDDAAAAAAPTARGGGMFGDLDEETKKQRLQMMSNTERMKQGSHQLRHAERLLNETEDLGNEALVALKSQTEQIQGIQDTTRAVDEEVSEARKILNSMHKTMMKHKLMLVAVIVVLMLLIIVILYVKISSFRSNKPLQPQQSTTQMPVPPSPIPTATNPGGLPSD